MANERRFQPKLEQIGRDGTALTGSLAALGGLVGEGWDHGKRISPLVVMPSSLCARSTDESGSSQTKRAATTFWRVCCAFEVFDDAGRALAWEQTSQLQSVVSGQSAEL